jgi:RNA polymerase sigma factor (sigma-70 family)
MTETEQLLADYVQNGSETAFRELVTRYIHFVYSTALRLVNGNNHLAEDVTQIVFIGLARKAAAFPSGVMLGGWLHQHTFHVATKALRAERRRQSRETQAMQMNALSDDSGNHWQKIAPLLDEAITRLGAEDRQAILLRFFEQRDFRSVGVALGSNEDAARMRVNRALEKLHSILKRRGVTLSAVALGTALASEAVTAAPAGLAASVAGVVLSGGVVAGGISTTILKIISMTKIQTALLSAVVVTGVAVPVVIQQHARAQLRAKDEILQEQGDQLAQLTAESQQFSNQLVQAKNSRALTHGELDELLRLRNETGELKRKLAEMAKQTTEQAAADSPVKPPLDPAEEQRQQALQKLEYMQKMDYAKQWALVAVMYAADNHGQLPASFGDATNYYKSSGLLAMSTNEFEITYHGSLTAITNPASAIVLQEIAAPGATLKTYGFADGHVEVHKANDGNFQDWEAQHAATPAGQ